MPEGVKPRRYDSPRRRAQAAATRRDILEAAERVFLRHGYAATTMGAIADEAGVALKTVYVAYASKSGVLRALASAPARRRGRRADPGARLVPRGARRARSRACAASGRARGAAGQGARGRVVRRDPRGRARR